VRRYNGETVRINGDYNAVDGQRDDEGDVWEDDVNYKHFKP
jgi:hypothetical protein